jgi:hypothetical protein
MRIAVPSHLYNRVIEYVRFSISGGGTSVKVDTTIKNFMTGSGTVRLAFAPRPAGACRFECRIRFDGGNLEYSDSLIVLENNAELMADDQNTVLLNQFAIPVPLNDTVDFLTFLQTDRQAGPGLSTQRNTVRIRQSAALLAVLFFLMAAEWFIRKHWRFD